MTIAILLIVAIPVAIVLWYHVQRRRCEREHDMRLHREAMRYVPRCEWIDQSICDCPGRCEASEAVRRLLGEAGVEVGAR